jgi:hypothetical protein
MAAACSLSSLTPIRSSQPLSETQVQRKRKRNERKSGKRKRRVRERSHLSFCFLSSYLDAILCRKFGREIVKLSSHHDGTVPAEKKRVEENGGKERWKKRDWDGKRGKRAKREEQRELKRDERERRNRKRQGLYPHPFLSQVPSRTGEYSAVTVA